MPFERSCFDAEARKNSHRLLADCLQRISSGDPRATYDLANIWMSHVFDRDPDIELGVVEGLMRHAARQGRAEASEFMEKLWPVLRILVRTRLNRCNQVQTAES